MLDIFQALAINHQFQIFIRYFNSHTYWVMIWLWLTPCPRITVWPFQQLGPFFQNVILFSIVVYCKCEIFVWSNITNILSTLWILMAWCFSTRASVTTVLSIHLHLSSCLWVVSLRPGDTYMPLWTQSPLVRAMAKHLFCNKLLIKPMLTYSELEPHSRTHLRSEIQFKILYNDFYSRKLYLKILSAKCQPFCFCLHLLTSWDWTIMHIDPPINSKCPERAKLGA